MTTRQAETVPSSLAERILSAIETVLVGQPNSQLILQLLRAILPLLVAGTGSAQCL